MSVYLTKASLNRHFNLATGLLLVSFISSCSSVNQEKGAKPSKPNASKIAEGDGVHLSDVIKKNIKREKLSTEREHIIKEIAMANSHRKSKSLLSFEDCLKNFHQADECRFLKKGWAKEWVTEWAPQDVETEAEMIKVSRSKRQKIAEKIVKNIKTLILEPAADQRPGDIYRALKKFSAWTPELQNFSEKLIAESSCKAPELYHYLGLKAEEYFPNDVLLKTVLKLYGKVDECAKDHKAANSRYVQNSRFRLGLLNVLDRNCDRARTVLDKLSKLNVSDFTTRAHYWAAHCDKADSKSDDFFSHYGELFKTNPLGFHTLSMGNGESVLVENLGKPIDPLVQSRSESNPQFNSWISVIEDLELLGEKEAVRRMFSPIQFSPHLLNSFEPSVRLYLSTFAFRANDRIALFRILDSVFRTQSEYVVDSTMKMFYPMEHLKEILDHAKKTSPFLIAALIRQESAFNADARSLVGAVGLMQLMPATARHMERKVKKAQLLNADTNVRLGVRYFEMLIERFKGDVELALASYNAGPEAVDQWIRRYPIKNRMLFLDLIPFSETRNYVTLIGRNYYWYRQLYAGKISETHGIDVVQKSAVFNGLKQSE